MTNPHIALLLAFTLLTVNTANDAVAKDTKKPEAAVGSALNIAAVVNDKAISSFDVNNRIKFIIATTKISNTPDTLAKIRPQVIRTLIDESLQIQEAEKNNIEINDQEIAQAIASIEAQRQMPAGGIANMLATNNVPEKTFNDQIRAQLAWNKIITRNIRGRIKISDEEVALAGGRITSAEPVNVSIKEMEIAVINLPIDKPAQEAEIKKLGDKLYSELRKGANFEEIARQFSAGGDGKPFWIRPEQLDSNISQTLKATKEGVITAPIRTGNGLSIIKLLHIRANKSKAKDNAQDSKIALKEILLKLKPTATIKEADVLLQIGEEVAKNPGNCEDKGVANISDLDAFDIEVNLRKTTLSELPPALRSISESLKIGDISTPFASAEGIRLYMLCEKEKITGVYINADKIKDGLFRQKFELEAQKYLRDLQRSAFIDIRQ